MKRYTMVVRRDGDGLATPALKIRRKGEVVKFEDVEESHKKLKASTSLLNSLLRYVEDDNYISQNTLKVNLVKIIDDLKSIIK